MIEKKPEASEYAPYNKLPAFAKGFTAYDWIGAGNPYDPNSVDAQAFDRGLELAMRQQRWNERKAD